MLSQIVGLLGGLVSLGLYTLAYRHAALVEADAFWTHPLGWVLALILYDFCYYWLHRKSHEVALLWAAHVVHHQSQAYNLSTALRQTSSGFVFGWLFYLPMALLGVPPLVFAVVALVDLLYQFWVHTEQIGSLGRFDRWLCSPSNHRVHHATNDRYLDKNHGGIFMVWDHLFGTFEPEDPAEPCVYGTRAPLHSWNPLWANAEVYAHLWRTAVQTRRWRDKLQVWWQPPGWLPPDVNTHTPATRFIPQAVPRFQVALSASARGFAVVQFVGLLAATAGFLWVAPAWSLSQQMVGVLALAVAFWAQGQHLQQQASAWACLAVQVSALSTVSSAWAWHELHWFAKPASMVFLMGCVWGAAKQSQPSSQDTWSLSASQRWLMAALMASLIGDVLLMGPAHWFVGGLAAFLCAHLCYLRVFKLGVGWWPHRMALGCTLGVGAGMYAVLLTGLPAGLRVPVAAYVLVIALMAAQAWGRAHVLRTPSARWVAWGTVAFMCSDALLGLNRFVQPLPLSPVWVLSTYYLAQTLIVFHCKDEISNQV
jgi:sterol desaturase/sphingolipid hydroxylase (fatty acid hydroxylase superfamily)/uncharacterized membrane protein YhhN